MALKILCCSSSLDLGGSERQLWQLACNLPQSQFAPHLFLLHRRGPLLKQLPDHIPLHAFDESKFRGKLPGAIHRAQVGYLRRLLQTEKIDLLYDRTYHLTLVSCKACWATNTPRVSTIVSPPSRDFAHSRERFRWLKYRLLRNAYRDHGALTLAVSEAVADDAARYYKIPRERFHVLRSPVDMDAIQKMAAESVDLPADATALGVPVCRIAVVARLSAEKGHALVMDMVQQWQRASQSKQLPQIQVDFVGDGPLADELKRQTVDKGLGQQIHFRGMQTNPYAWMQRADVICIPSSYEGLPNVALEAMALKRPLISTRCSPAITELLGDQNQRGVLLNESTAAGLLRAIVDTYTDTLRSQERVAAAYQWVAEHHGLGPWIDQMTRLFRASAGQG